MSDGPKSLNEHATSGMPNIRIVGLYIVAGFLISFVAFLVFLSLPTLDLDISSTFFSESTGFDLTGNDFISFIRETIIWFIFIFYIFVIWHGFRSFRKQKPSFVWLWDKWAFLGACALLGPVFIVNILLKGNWGRSRPRHLEVFGDSQEFTQFWEYADQCRDNCSFASGEVAGVAMIFISLSLLLEKRLRILVLCLGTIATAVTAWLRVSIGAHFITDTIVVTALMLISAAPVYYAFYVRKNNWITMLNDKQQKKIEAKRMRRKF